MRTRTRTMLAGLVLAAALVGGVAWATIPGANGTIQGCYTTGNGNLRVVDSADECRNSETAISWNQQGIQGAQGAQGIRGDQGPQGLKGDTGAAGADGTNGTNGTDGSDGAQGAEGEAGEKGDKGDPGQNGADGQDGAAGADGPKGDKGDQGSQGVQGSPGPAGGILGIVGIGTSGSIPPNAQLRLIATCPPGKKPLSGSFATFQDAEVLASGPIDSASWYAIFRNKHPSQAIDASVGVLCATMP